MIKKQMNILIVDDEMELRKSVSSILKTISTEIDFCIDEASDGEEALEKVKIKDYELILMDVRMPKLNGLEALVEIKTYDPRIFVVIMTAHSNLNDAILAIKEGAYDYVEKPVDPKKLTDIVLKTFEAKDLVSTLTISNPIFDDDIESEIVGQNQKMKDVFGLIYKLCKVDTTVLIRGENGTGKELVARAIHFNSPRKSGAFVALNCGAIPETLMESELFGHEKGAFTGAVERKIGKFQLANNGTLFLDEIGELKPDMQVKLLRVLQDKKFTPVGSNREVKSNARIIAATNRNLEKMMNDGDFREDLFYRLNVMPIFLPPLRERVEDIEELAQHFIKKFSKIHNSSIQSLHPLALQCLKAYAWPGNIRELENIIERAFIVENGAQITLTSLPENLREPNRMTNSSHASEVTTSKPTAASSAPMDFDVFKENLEKEFIVSALKANKGRINQTVATANIPKNTLLRKIRKYNINVKEFLEE